jgi:Tol biopolymer transport system component
VIEEHDVSPDGRWLVFDSDVRGTKDLFKIRVAGGDAVGLTALPGHEEGPKWSPDGREIAFHYYLAADNRIMVVPADGGPPIAPTADTTWSGWPAWSPDGLSIAFWSVRAGTRQLWLLVRDTAGGAWHETGPLADHGAGELTWAPDGSGILCDTDSSILLVSPGGRELWRRDEETIGLILDQNARFSQDGRWFYRKGRDRDGRRGVWAVPVGGGAPRLLIATDDPMLDFGTLSVGANELYVTVYQYESDIWVATLNY